jgi:hypothetical protein
MNRHHTKSPASVNGQQSISLYLKYFREEGMITHPKKFKKSVKVSSQKNLLDLTRLHGMTFQR